MANPMEAKIEIERVAAGIWKLRFGTPERFTPTTFSGFPPRLDALDALPPAPHPPIDPAKVAFRQTPRGLLVEIPMGDAEQIYGFGLQLKSLNQTGKKRVIRVNSDPLADTGDSHAPVPFYVSTAGYGVYVDTARYATFYAGSHAKVGQGKATPSPFAAGPGVSTEELYRARSMDGRHVLIEIPSAQGVDIFFFAGPEMKQAVQRYNLFSGGGCLPPLWGLGMWYRVFTGHSGETALEMAKSFRDAHLPIDVIGLEPGWQGKSYSCSYVWCDQRYPNPQSLIDGMRALGYHLNLWEHVFVHPDSPIYPTLKPLSGDYEVWGGVVPDLSIPAARKAFADFHEEAFVARGVSGFKLDECDNSDFIASPWSFPEATHFPSGMDGEQMHSLIGPLYQQTIYEVFRRRNQRTLSQVRAAHGLAAPYPFVLYSDLYDHRDFVRGLTTMGFGGLLWTPEVREGGNIEGLIRRIQSVVLSPQALINGWYIKHPPWHQVDMGKNNRDELMADRDAVEAACRELFRFRMTLIPYLYSAFARYYFEGVPPFRALVMDWPDDPATHKIDDAFLIGDSLLAAPMFAGQSERELYLPAGEWYDFHTHRKLLGAQKHTIAADLKTIPLFVKSGAILPLAEPVEYVADDTVFDVTVRTFGPRVQSFALFEDDGVSFNFERGEFSRLILSWTPENGPRVERKGNFPATRHRISRWEHID